MPDIGRSAEMSQQIQLLIIFLTNFGPRLPDRPHNSSHERSEDGHELAIGDRGGKGGVAAFDAASAFDGRFCGRPHDCAKGPAKCGDVYLRLAQAPAFNLVDDGAAGFDLGLDLGSSVNWNVHGDGPDDALQLAHYFRILATIILDLLALFPEVRGQDHAGGGLVRDVIGVRRSSCSQKRSALQPKSRDPPGSAQCLRDSSFVAPSSPASVSGYMRSPKISLINEMECV